MTKRDFELIARTLRNGFVESNTLAATTSPQVKLFNMDQHRSMSKSFANELATTNPNFDRARFLAACGVEGDA